MEIRGEAFHVLNHPSFGQPGATVSPGSNAEIRSVTVGGRTMQLYRRPFFIQRASELLPRII